MLLGESRVTSPQDLLGKSVHVNLMALTNDPRKQSFNVRFLVKSVDGDTGVADLIEYQMGRAYVRRVVRKGTSRVDDSFVVRTKDNVHCLVKPLFVTKHHVNNKIATSLRKKVRELLARRVAQTTSSELFTSVIHNQLQMDLKRELKRIYPLTTSEIRVLEILPENRLAKLSPVMIVHPTAAPVSEETEETLTQEKSQEEDRLEHKPVQRKRKQASEQPPDQSVE